MASDGVSKRVPAEETVGCGAFSLELALLVDGELGDVERASVETHLSDCPRCSEAIAERFAFRDTLRRSSPAAPAPAGLRSRITAALDAEPLTDAAPTPPAPLPALAQPRPARAWARRRLPLAAAGASVLSVGVWLLATPARSDDVLRDIVARHSRRQPLEFQGDDPRSLEQWLSDKVDFRVKVPRIRQGTQLNLVGARLSHVKDHQAVYVLFGTPQSPPRHVSLVVFDDPAQAPPLQGEPRRVDDRDVYVANAQGYNVALWKQNEVVYSLVSDGDDDVVELVRAASAR